MIVRKGKNISLFLFLILIASLAHSCGGGGGGGEGGTPTTIITWSKTYGRIYEDTAYSIQQTIDGGYIIAGVTLQDSNNEILVIKIDAYGNTIWQYTEQGIATSIINSGDGGYLVAGQLFPGPIGDIGIIKLNSNGQVEWDKTYNKAGGIGNEIIATSDGGYIIVGGAYDNVYVIKIDANGNTKWEKSYGASQKGIGYSIIQTSDGYVIAGEITLMGRMDSDIWIFKIDSNGKVIWEKNFGGTGYDAAYSLKLTSDGGYIVAGKKSSAAGDADFWIAKLKENGDLDWEKTYGSSNEEIARSIRQTSAGGYIVAGETTTSAGDTDFLILKLDATGGVIWEKTYGSSANDIAYSIQQTQDGGYIVAGETTTTAGDTDFWVLKLDANGNLN